MRLLKVTVNGAGLFSEDSFSVDFFAENRVSGKRSSGLNDVFRLNPSESIYSQNVVAFSGVNASGKTTALKLVALVMRMLLTPAAMRLGTSAFSVPPKMNDYFSVKVVFWEGGKYYLLESSLHKSKSSESEDSFRWYRIDDELLWVLESSRPNKLMMKSIDEFKKNAHIYLRRKGSESDEAVISQEARRFLMNSVSIATAVIEDDDLNDDGPSMLLRTDHASEVVHAFDNSVEYLKWDSELEVFRLKFAGDEERLIGDNSIYEVLSNGTIVGVNMVESALDKLRTGGFVIIDEIEFALNKSLIKSFIELFQSHSTNPKGAQLIFSTHYVELLDYLPRKDNVYLLVRDKKFATEIVKYSDRITRVENKKSEVVLANAIKGAMPSYPDVEGMRAYAREYVHG